MATAQDIIDSALRLLNVLASGETPTAIERADGLITLNQMLSSWNSEGIAIPYVSTDGYTLVGAASVTIGTGGNISTTRPLVILSMTVTAGSNKQKLKPVTAEGYAALADMSRAGKFAKYYWFNPLTPTLAGITLWPTPASGGSLLVDSLKPITQFGSLAASVSLPEGYERALRALLALELAPEYGAKVTDVLAKNAAEAKANIINLNAAVLGVPPSQAQQEKPAA